MAFWNVVRIVPVALEAAWGTATAVGGDADGLAASSYVYTEADATPRTATHHAGNGSLNAAQLALLQGAGEDGNGYIQVDNIDPGLAGVLCKVWDRSLGAGNNPYSSMLSENGLTTSAT